MLPLAMWVYFYIPVWKVRVILNAVNDLSVCKRESAIPEIFRLVLKMNKVKLQNFRISFFDFHWVFRLIHY